MTTPTRIAKIRTPEQPELSRVQDNIARTVEPVARALQGTPIMGAAPPAWVRPSKYSQDFADVSATLQTAMHQDALGYVWLRLTATTPGGVGAGSEVFVLGGTFCPRTTIPLLAFNGSTNAVNPLSIDATGSVKTLVAVGAGQSIRGYVAFLAGA